MAVIGCLANQRTSPQVNHTLTLESNVDVTTFIYFLRDDVEYLSHDRETEVQKHLLKMWLFSLARQRVDNSLLKRPAAFS